MAAALDRTQISDRQAAQVLIPFAVELGHDVNELALSRASIGRRRKANRTEQAAELKEAFAPSVPLTIHWDGKLMPDLTGRDKVDRLPVLVSGDGQQKILAVQKLGDRKAEGTAAVILDAPEDWKVKDRIVAMCFDTTAVNTGAKSGVCLRLEMSLGRQLIYLACRHHMMEIVLEHVFSALLTEQSRSPDITLFLNFRDMWPMIDQTKYTTARDDESTLHRIQPWREETVSFAQDQLLREHPRDDYKELLELVIIFLGSVPHRQTAVRFHAPGAVHRARWMSRAVYALKLWIFFDQYEQLQPTRSSTHGPNRNDHLRTKLTEFCVFVAHHYVCAWFSAPSAACAPRTDLSLLKELSAHPHKAIKSAGTKAMARHLWHLSEVTVGLALFDDEVTNEEKSSMVHNMKAVEGATDPVPRVTAFVQDLVTKNLPDFFTASTTTFLKALAIDDSFLEAQPHLWSSMQSYVEGKQRVNSLLVTNDAAERGVALIQQFTANGRTKQEDQLQAMVQVVEQHRRKYPNATKKELMK